MSNFWPKTGHDRLRNLSSGRFQYLTEKQNGYLQSSPVREVVAMRELTEFSAYIEEK